MKRKIYVAHPFQGLEENKTKVENIIKELSKENPNNVYISPIHTFGYMFNDVSYDIGMEWCLELLKSCDELLLCGDWVQSVGCCRELSFARDNNIEVKFNYIERKIINDRDILNGLDKYIDLKLKNLYNIKNKVGLNDYRRGRLDILEHIKKIIKDKKNRSKEG